MAAEKAAYKRFSFILKKGEIMNVISCKICFQNCERYLA